MVNHNLDYDALENANVYDNESKKIGTIGQVYLDDETQRPKFMTVNIGLFGSRETFIPLESASQSEDGVTVPFSKNFIKDAPNVEVDGHLTPDEERRLFEYYSLDYEGSDRGAAGGRRTEDRGGDAAAQAGGRGRDDAGRGAGDRRGDRAGREGAEGEMVAHEERLEVGTEQHEAGRARLHKRVRTEHQNVDVPVQREELVVEREEIDPDSTEARSTGGIDSEDTEETVTLREERPVVDKETVATEKVNIGKRTVQDTETVSGDVRREEIELEDEENKPDRRR
ncbi:PRC and DUF2382 domain-containing protein [Rothia halotolerans]|uniref:PRC and DUF2382 domain-containing protein n=1 Tax=Rothia halotolerans TaxID=405770 RepID=UPI00101C8612|nr:PRC and DUF2382 domain-containing protein [Rothia halotolerans]